MILVGGIPRALIDNHTGRRAFALNNRRPWCRTLATEVDTRANDAAFEDALRDGAGLTAKAAIADPRDMSPKPLQQPTQRRRSGPKRDPILESYLTFKHMREFNVMSLYCAKAYLSGQNKQLVATVRRSRNSTNHINCFRILHDPPMSLSNSSSPLKHILVTQRHSGILQTRDISLVFVKVFT